MFFNISKLKSLSEALSALPLLRLLFSDATFIQLCVEDLQLISPKLITFNYRLKQHKFIFHFPFFSHTPEHMPFMLL